MYTYSCEAKRLGLLASELESTLKTSREFSRNPSMNMQDQRSCFQEPSPISMPDTKLLHAVPDSLLVAVAPGAVTAVAAPKAHAEAVAWRREVRSQTDPPTTRWIWSLSLIPNELHQSD